MLIHGLLEEVGCYFVQNPRSATDGYKTKQGWLWKAVQNTRGTFLKRLAFYLNRKTYKEWTDAEDFLVSSPDDFWEIIGNSARYEQAYNLLEDEFSKEVFKWILRARMHRAFDWDWQNKLTAPKSVYQGDLSCHVSTDEFGTRFKGLDPFRETDQYLLDDICRPVKGDVVLDIGAFAGDTALMFSSFVGDEGHVYSFEAMQDTFAVLQDNMKYYGCNNVTPFYKAAWNENKDLFMSGSGKGAKVGDGSNAVPGVRIDDFVKQNGIEKVDFVKMDIEGAEQQALAGMTETISRHHPKLALCVYHKRDDVYRIMEIVREIDPSYKFYMRTYGANLYDIVLYAV